MNERKTLRMAKRQKTAARPANPNKKTRKAERAAATPAKKPRRESRRPARRRPDTARSKLDRAQELAYEASVASDLDETIALAEKALGLSADCADAYIVLSRIVSDPRQALALAAEGLAAAERALGAERLAASAGRFWRDEVTRPYLRARLAYGERLWSIGRRDEAAGHLLDMLRLNPADNQGVRYLLAAHLIELGRDEDFDRLIARYDEPLASVLFSRVLREFRRSGDSAAARRLLAKARLANRHVVTQLLDGAPHDDDLPRAFSPGTVSEAVLYVEDFAGGWKQTPGAITWLRQRADAATKKPRKAPAGPTAAAKKQLMQLEQKYGAVWQVAVTRVPTWLRDGAILVRPWSILIVDHTEHLIIGQDLASEQPSAAALFEHLAKAMQRPLAGKSHRPSEVQVRDEPLWNELQAHLEEIGIDCIFRSQLEEADFILGEMKQLMQAEGQPPALVGTPLFTSSQGASFYAAAAAYFRRAPWNYLPPNATIQVDCPQLREFGPGLWYAVVLGQGGQTLGLAVYSDLRDIEEIVGGCCSDDDRKHGTAVSLIYGENFEIPIADLVAAEEHGWPLASPEANPLVLCTQGDELVRPLEHWELQLLEGCARTIPDFLAQCPYADGPGSATLGPVPPQNLKFTLSWVETDEGGCGEDCDHCEH